MIVRPKTFLEAFNEEVSKSRTEIQSLKGVSTGKLLTRFDEYVAMARGYVSRKVVIFKYHFDYLWGENTFIVSCGRTSSRYYNTASLYIDHILRILGKKFGWLKEKKS